jgi:hypothetical protein
VNRSEPDPGHGWVSIDHIGVGDVPKFNQQAVIVCYWSAMVLVTVPSVTLPLTLLLL